MTLELTQHPSSPPFTFSTGALMQSVHHLPRGQNEEMAQSFPSDTTHLSAYHVVDDQTPQPFLTFDTSPVAFKPHTWDPVIAPDSSEAPITKMMALLDVIPQLIPPSTATENLKITLVIPLHVWKMYPSFDDIGNAVDLGALYERFMKIASPSTLMGSGRRLGVHMEFVWCRLYAPWRYPELNYWSTEERTTTSLFISSGIDSVSKEYSERHSLVDFGSKGSLHMQYKHTYIPY